MLKTRERSCIVQSDHYRQWSLSACMLCDAFSTVGRSCHAMVTHQTGATHHFRTRHAQRVEAYTVMLVFSSPCFSAGTYPLGGGHQHYNYSWSPTTLHARHTQFVKPASNHVGARVPRRVLGGIQQTRGTPLLRSLQPLLMCVVSTQHSWAVCWQGSSSGTNLGLAQLLHLSLQSESAPDYNATTRLAQPALICTKWPRARF